ncbi:hypothetical protein VI06_13050 [Aquitalea magnusonii]|jgi:hypothetical protein|uniref:Conserved hypothetical secreted protein n=1 Tax=Aquitalea magnusonii TaxID=332411 RepID=A0A0F3K9P2_9NEIS|nr:MULTISPECIES: hypothetical protein [Aquitalea]KJV27990.1 hypothetical protein VI06_13050 [Aquitalea magnusonii]QBJ78589.1 hypothetical protein DKK66_11195 [Aquitalea sp. USM4]BBF86769.1 conserved hypothetical secreted protein [Aquitalea magnusonii]
MRKFVMMALLTLATANVALAADASCDAKAAEKKLAGAAKASFLKKCEKDSKAAAPQAMCEGKAADKKLAGAAKNSFVKKCVKDAASAAK